MREFCLALLLAFISTVLPDFAAGNPIHRGASGNSGIQNPREFAQLISNLHSDNVQARRAAAQALGSLSDSRAVDALIEALDDKDTLVRRFVTAALLKIGGEHIVDRFIGNLLHPDIRIRNSAARALAEIAALRDQRTIERMIKGLDDQSALVRWGSAKALTGVRNAKQRGALSIKQFEGSRGAAAS